MQITSLWQSGKSSWLYLNISLTRKVNRNAQISYCTCCSEEMLKGKRVRACFVIMNAQRLGIKSSLNLKPDVIFI